MRILFEKRFHRKYKKLPKNVQSKCDEALRIFHKDSFDARLKNHKLKGSLSGLNAIAVTGDCRAVFYVEKDVVIFVDIGNHNRVYFLMEKGEKLY